MPLRRNSETRVFSQELGKRNLERAEHLLNIKRQMRALRANENVVSLTKQMNLDPYEKVRVNKQTAATCPSCVSRGHEIRFGNGVNPWGETDCARTAHDSNVFNPFASSDG